MRMAVSTAKSFSRKESRTCAATQLATRGLWLRSISVAIPQMRGVDHLILRPLQQLRQLGDIGRDAPGFGLSSRAAKPRHQAAWSESA